jgi:hypothetical protein
MARSTTAPQALRTLRQRGSVAMGVIAMVLSGGMALLSLVDAVSSLVFLGCMLLGCLGAWLLFVRPCVVLTMAGVELHNPLRHTRIPWSKVDDVAARWNLEVWSGDRSYPAWAIASHIERPQGGGGVLAMGRLGSQAARDEATAPKPSGGATVGSSARMIEAAMGEYAELVANGDGAAVAGQGQLTREWQWLEVALLVVPALLVVVGLFL